MDETAELLSFFTYEHLPEHLQAVSRPFCDLAVEIAGTIPRNRERTVALRKLLEAKDCAVRAVLLEAKRNENPVFTGPFNMDAPLRANRDYFAKDSGG